MVAVNKRRDQLLTLNVLVPVSHIAAKDSLNLSKIKGGNKGS